MKIVFETEHRYNYGKESENQNFEISIEREKNHSQPKEKGFVFVNLNITYLNDPSQKSGSILIKVHQSAYSKMKTAYERFLNAPKELKLEAYNKTYIPRVIFEKYKEWIVNVF